jgi:predicted tellurium resistance membrane protein TerC
MHAIAALTLCTSPRIRSRAMDWFGWVYDPNAWVSLVTLTILEIVLGIDNVVFISILTGKLPVAQQAPARTTGLALALITRVLLLCIKWLMGLTKPLFVIFAHEISGKDLILIAGGLFLIAKSTQEIHARMEPEEPEGKFGIARNIFWGTIAQIVLLDIVFSLDSVITAVGLANEIPVMVVAITIAIVLMLVAAGTISKIIDRHPTIKMLALAFLLMIGIVLIADGVGQHIERGYIYVAMAFSTAVEILNLRVRSKTGKS